MGRVTLTLPRLGETMEEARVTAWLVAPGAAFRRGDVLLEVETDKTVVEVPALEPGTLVAQLVAAGETVGLDQPIAEVEVTGGAQGPFASPGGGAGHTDAPPAARSGGETGLPDTATGVSAAVDAGAADANRRRGPAGPLTAAAGLAPIDGPRVAASPAARAAARSSRIDLAGIAGTGRHGRITAADVAAAGRRDTAAAVVLLHGLFDDARTWHDLSARLRSAGLAVAAPDLPGDGGGTGAEVLSHAVAVVRAGLPAGPLVLVGHSLGCVLATRLAAGLGDRARALILLAPAGLGTRIDADFLDGMLHAATPAALARALAMTGGGPLSQAALAGELDRLGARRPGDAAMAAALARGGIQQVDIAPELARLGLPLTVVFGTADRILDWRCVARLPSRAAIHLIAGAGHLPHQADAGLVAGLVAAAACAPGRAAAAQAGRKHLDFSRLSGPEMNGTSAKPTGNDGASP